MTSYADQNETAPPLGHANCETVAMFVAPPVITPLSDRGLFSAYDMSRKNDAVNCEHVAVARFSWAKRSRVLRTVQGVML